jgi:hypothetical protein
MLWLDREMFAAILESSDNIIFISIAASIIEDL